MQTFKEYMEMCEQEWEDDALFEMANMRYKTHGIRDIVIWVGESNNQHGLRIKISNKKNRWDKSDHFVIQMPSMKYNKQNVAGWITQKHLSQIIEWIEKNYSVLSDYENGIINDTIEFLERIEPV
jgi:hypothetical protein